MPKIVPRRRLLADQWAKDRRAELDAGRLRALVAALRIHVETTPEARKCIHYVFGNRHRMRYPKFRAKGLCISSGVVEAGCKQIGARLKRTGMRWTVAGANAIMALRCCILSGRFEDWERPCKCRASALGWTFVILASTRRCWSRKARASRRGDRFLPEDEVCELRSPWPTRVRACARDRFFVRASSTH